MITKSINWQAYCVGRDRRNMKELGERLIKLSTVKLKGKDLKKKERAVTSTCCKQTFLPHFLLKIPPLVICSLLKMAFTQHILWQGLMAHLCGSINFKRAFFVVFFTEEHAAQKEADRLRDYPIHNTAQPWDSQSQAVPWCLPHMLNQQELNKYTDTKQTKSSSSQVAHWRFENRNSLKKAVQYLVEQGWTKPELAVDSHE